MKIINLVIGALWLLLLAGCQEDKNPTQIVFATSADYPPFEYLVKGQFHGFDIALATEIAKLLHKTPKFQDMTFSSILAALQSGVVDAGISTITATPQRLEKFDFSEPYYTEAIAMVFLRQQPIKTVSQMNGKKIGCQLGTTMESWLKQHAPNSQIVVLDTNYQAIESLKSGYVDGVLLDSIQARAFSRNDAKLAYAPMGKADLGYAIVFKKGSPLKKKVDAALNVLRANGVLEALKQRYLVGDAWMKS